MKITTSQVEAIERLTDLGLKVVLFLFILEGAVVLTGFYIYCVVNDKGTQAKAISGLDDAVFFRSICKAGMELLRPKNSKPKRNRHSTNSR